MNLDFRFKKNEKTEYCDMWMVKVPGHKKWFGTTMCHHNSTEAAKQFLTKIVKTFMGKQAAEKPIKQ